MEAALHVWLAYQILLLALRLTGQIAWSYWWVLAPTWIPVAIGILLLMAAGLGRLGRPQVLPGPPNEPPATER